MMTLLLFQHMHRTAHRLYRLYQLSNPVFRLPRFMPLEGPPPRRHSLPSDPLHELHPALFVFPHCLRLKLKYPSFPGQNIREPLIPLWETFNFMSWRRRMLFYQGKLS
jgi:hypothetical protein